MNNECIENWNEYIQKNSIKTKDCYEPLTRDDCLQHIKQLIDFYFDNNNIFILSDDCDYLDEDTKAETLYSKSIIIMERYTNAFSKKYSH